MTTDSASTSASGPGSGSGPASASTSASATASRDAADPAAPPTGPPRAEAAPGALGRVLREGLPFLRGRAAVLTRLGAWSLLEFAQTFLGGYGVARALDQGFLAGRVATGLLWLGVAALAVVPAGLAMRGVFAGLADLVEPLRDGLVRRAVARALHGATGARAQRSARSVSQVTHQSEIARDGWAGLVLTLRSFVFTAAGALAGLASLAPALLLVVLPPLAVGLIVFAATLGPTAAAQRTYLGADEAFAEGAGRAAAALRDIAAAGGADVVAAGSRALAEQQAAAARALARWSAVRVLALAVCGRLPPLALLAAAPWLTRHGLTGGALVGALTYLTQSLAPAVHALMTVIGTAGGRLVVVLDRFTGPVPPPAEPAAGVAATAVPAGPAVPAAELRSVSFAYAPTALPVLDRLDLTVAQGERLAVVGPSGSGKSTLAAVLAGVAGPTGGEVRWQGRPAGTAFAPSARTLLPQQAYVFSGSVRENLCYLRPGAPAADFAAMVADLGLESLIGRLGGPDAALDPGQLSLGERQLIALGRAHLAAAPLLILDEATSHLDAATEARAERALAQRCGAMVVVAHRLSSAHRADRVLVLDGERTMTGTSAQLRDDSALYRDLAGVWAPDQD